MRLIFIRHPKTEANERKLVYGRTDALYSEAGAATIPGIVEELRDVRIDSLYASPLTRTRLLAEAIADDHQIPHHQILMDDRILEMDFGCFENMTIAQLEETYPAEYHSYISDFNEYQVPGGESYRQLYHRVGGFLKEIYQRHEIEKRSGQKGPNALELEVGAEPPLDAFGMGEEDEDETQSWLNLRPREERAEGQMGEAAGETRGERSGENGAWFELKQAMDQQKIKREQTVVVVAHSMVIHAALSHLLNLDLNDVWHIKIEPGSLVDLDWRSEFAMLQRLSGPFNVRDIK